MNISWEKVACALLAGALALSGWGLFMVHEMDVKLGRIEAKMEIWHTPIGGDQAMLAGYSPSAQRLEFLQRASIRAYNSIKDHQYDAALRTIILGLEESGLHCKEYRNSLRCE